MKTLYFEGAGMDCLNSDIKNCRIRTAFHNEEGDKFYIELGGWSSSKVSDNIIAGHVDTCFKITDDTRNDENMRQIGRLRHYRFDWNKQNILKIIKSINPTFDNIEVLPDLAGYYVFSDNSFGDEFIYDAELTARAEIIKNYYHELEKSEGKKYPNFSLWTDDKDNTILHLLRHYNGYNKHWSIKNVPEWKTTVNECKLGRYGC